MSLINFIFYTIILKFIFFYSVYYLIIGNNFKDRKNFNMEAIVLFQREIRLFFLYSIYIVFFHCFYFIISKYIYNFIMITFIFITNINISV